MLTQNGIGLLCVGVHQVLEPVVVQHCGVLHDFLDVVED